MVTCDLTEGVRLGLTTCYDLRFPEMYQVRSHPELEEASMLGCLVLCAARLCPVLPVGW
jgi:predicted amidohydrolase